MSINKEPADQVVKVQLGFNARDKQQYFKGTFCKCKIELIITSFLTTRGQRFTSGCSEIFSDVGLLTPYILLDLNK